MQDKEIYTQDITQCFYNAGSYKLEAQEIEQAEAEAEADLEKEINKWDFISSYKLSI